MAIRPELGANEGVGVLVNLDPSPARECVPINRDCFRVRAGAIRVAYERNERGHDP